MLFTKARLACAQFIIESVNISVLLWCVIMLYQGSLACTVMLKLGISSCCIHIYDHGTTYGACAPCSPCNILEDNEGFSGPMLKEASAYVQAA